MIHDFATLPRAQQVPAPRQSAPPRPRRVGRYVVGALFVSVISISLTAIGYEPSGTAVQEAQLAEAETQTAETVTVTAATSADALVDDVLDDSVAAVPASDATDETLWSFYERLAKAWPVPVQQGVYVDQTLTDRERPVYELQAASFRHREDALRLRSRLAERGLQAQVHSRTNPAGIDWHQVVVGPFDHSSTLNKAQDVLVSFNLMPLKRRIN